MSAELLREAADGLRGEYETDPYRLGQTMRAVADLLEQAAYAVEMGEDDNWPPQIAAVAVARAFLGLDA